MNRKTYKTKISNKNIQDNTNLGKKVLNSTIYSYIKK